MENFLQKLSLKLNEFWIKEWERFKKTTKLYFLPLTISFKLTNKNKEQMYFLMDKNYHYGFLIETIILKLKLMRESWPHYKYNEKDIETLDILISKGTEILDILEIEDKENHLRSKEYQTKQKQFFDLLNVSLPELFY